MKGVNVFKDLKVIGEDKVTAIGMGTWGIGGYETPDYSNDNESIEALRYGLELGINLIDTAEFYGAGHSEEIVGKAIKEYERESIFIITDLLPALKGEAFKSVKFGQATLGIRMF